MYIYVYLFILLTKFLLYSSYSSIIKLIGNNSDLHLPVYRINLLFMLFI